MSKDPSGSAAINYTVETPKVHTFIFILFSIEFFSIKNFPTRKFSTTYEPGFWEKALKVRSDRVVGELAQSSEMSSKSFKTSENLQEPW